MENTGRYKTKQREIILGLLKDNYKRHMTADEVILFYLTDNGFVKKTYMQNFNASVVQETFVEDLSEIKCYNGQKVGLYGVKQGVLCKIDADNGEITNLNIKAKNVLAGKEDCFVFRDFDIGFYSIIAMIMFVMAYNNKRIYKTKILTTKTNQNII